MKLYITVFFLFLISCKSSEEQIHSLGSLKLQAVNTATCTLAVPDDSFDDTPAIQNSINSKCCLGPGIFDVGMTPLGKNGRRSPNMLTIRTGGELCGSGESTIIKFHGDATLMDWRGVEVIGNNIAVHDLTLNTEDLSNTIEQTHELHVTGPVDGLYVHDVWFKHPLHPGFKGGDDIDFVGYAESMITNTRIDHNHFISSSRIGIQIHSGVHDMMITNNEFLDARVLDIGTEGTGVISNLTIAHNTHLVGPSQTGGTAIALNIVTDSTIVDNVLNRGIYFYACDKCAIDHNVITLGPGLTSNSVIEVIKISSELVITRNIITRTAGQSIGNLIRISPHTSTPKDSRIVGNTLIQQTNSTVIYASGIVGLLIANNFIFYEGNPESNVTGLTIEGSSGITGFRATDTVISHNSFSGPLKWAMSISGSYNGTGSVAIVGNSANQNVIGGLACSEGTGGVIGPVAYTGNTLPPPNCGNPSWLNLGL